MFKGGPVYTRFAAQMVRYAELFNPVTLIIFGILIQNGIIKSTYHMNVIGFYILVTIWMAIGIFQFLVPTKNSRNLFIRNILYHLLVCGYLLLVVGVASPLAASWIILIISAYVLSPARGAAFSIIGFAALVLFDIFVFNRGNTAIIGTDLFTLFIILSAGSTIVSIFQTQKVSQEMISLSKAKEFLQRDRIIAIVNNLTDAVLSIDTEGIIRVYNAASLNLLDTNDSLNGHHIDEILHLTDQNNESISLFKELQKTHSVVKRDDLNFTYSDDEKIRLEVTYTQIHKSYNHKTKSGDTQDGYVIIMRDITKLKSLEEERDEFISVTSHELRTPLTIAEGTLSNVQIMIDHPNATKKMLKDAIETAHEQILFLSHMVNDLSTLSRAERGLSDGTEDINVSELAHMMHDKYANDAKVKKLHLDLDLAPNLGHVHTSRLYLEELLQNFLTNAIKYTKKGSVTIVFTEKNNLITFAVKDTGIGLSKSDQSKVFDKFYRSEDYRTRESGGTGLGLYVAAKLAHKIGTKINLVSRLNFGSTFSFTLPSVSAERLSHSTNQAITK